MNANKLADELNRKCTGRLVGFAATMLRKLQAENEKQKEHIEMLEEECRAMRKQLTLGF